jgi:2-haloacid dehalogenase
VGGNFVLVIFDVVGTLFSLDRLRASIKAQGLAPELLPWWFGRLLQSAMAATLANRYLPFRQVAESSLKQVLAVAGRPEKVAEPILAEMKALAPWPDAGECLRSLHRSHRLVALTNSSVEAAEGLIGQAGLRDFFQDVLSTDDAHACKPDPRPYRMALDRAGCNPSEAWMVAAHGWDILGADAVGMRTVWIDRVEQRWPFPGHPPDLTASDLTQVAARIKGDNR